MLRVLILMKAEPLVLLIKSSVELMSFIYLFIGLLDTLQIWELQIPKVFLEKSKKNIKNLIIGLNFA
jgi:hypothetical protein